MEAIFWVIIAMLCLLLVVTALFVAFKCGEECGIAKYGYIEEEEEDEIPEEDK